MQFGVRREAAIVEQVDLVGFDLPALVARVELVHLHAVRGVVLSLDANGVGLDAQVRVFGDQDHLVLGGMEQLPGAGQDLVVGLVLVRRQDADVQVVGGHIHLEGAAPFQRHAPAEAARGPQPVQQAGHGAGIAAHLGLILLEVVHFFNHHDGQDHVMFLEVQDGVRIVQ